MIHDIIYGEDNKLSKFKKIIEQPQYHTKRDLRIMVHLE